MATGSATGAAATLDLLDRARHSLLEACQSQEVTRRYDQAQLGALRAAAAVVATRTTSSRPATGQSGPRSLWELLPTVAPELSEWAGFFEVVGARRHHGHSAREADDVLRQSELFLDLVCHTLGLPVTVSPHDHLLVPTALTHPTATTNTTATTHTTASTGARAAP
jgi:HEPN superfamily protein